MASLRQSLPDEIYHVSRDGVFLSLPFCAQKPETVFTPHYIGQNLNSVMTADVSEQFLYYVQKALEATDGVSFCRFSLDSAQKNHDFEARFSACGPHAVLILVRDITEYRKAEATLVETFLKLQESHDDILTILNQMRLAIAMTDDLGRVSFLSQAASKLLKLAQDEAIDRSWEKVFPFSAVDRKAIQDVMALPSKERGKITTEMELKDGATLWVDVEIRDDPADAKKKIFYLYDMTEVRHLRGLLDEKSQFQGLVGRSKRMRLVYEQIRELSNFDATVLITGETGTGKELVARALHFSSHRKKAPFIAVNCAGLTDSILASQLFGHKKGAFTGAIEDHQGLIEAARGGTLFLDEIGDIPPNVQVSLLRFLQEREITRLGEAKPRKVDVRVLAASQYDLAEEVARGRFRLDLLYRIRVAMIHLPPLKERKEDIPLLAQTFLQKSLVVSGLATGEKNIAGFDDDVMRIFMEQDWPGNVRELQGVIEFAAIRCKGHKVNLEDLPLEMRSPLISSSFSDWPHFTDTDDEKNRLMMALRQAHGNRTRAAQILGVSRATFYRKLTLVGLEKKMSHIVSKET